MATLNFKGAYQCSITGGNYGHAQHVTMISSSADPRTRDYYRHKRSSRSSRPRTRPPSPSSSESSSLSSRQSRQSSPPTSVDEHESSSSPAVPPVSRDGHDMLSPLSSRLGAMPGFTTPADLQTRVASLPVDPDVATISQPTEAPTLPQSHTPAHHNRHPGRDVGVRRPRPQGPRSRPLPPPPPSSQFVHRGTPVDLLSLTGSHSHTSESSSWDSFAQAPPHDVMRASTTPSRSSTRLLQPFPFSLRSQQADTFAHVNYSSRSSPSQAFLTSPFQEPFAELTTSESPSRRSVQSPPPVRPLRSVPLPSRSRTSTASRSRATNTIPRYYSTRSPPQAFWLSSMEQSYQSSVGPTNYSEMNVQNPTLYPSQHPSPGQIPPNQDFNYMPSSGIPQQYMPRSPYFAGGFAYYPPSLYPQPLQSEHLFHEGRGSHNGPPASSPRNY
ncbi:hypothetical protein Agabi119p4_10053 [Agaricus bisporus var. burnettii]|uniref:Uncharacterized protein n=1 Tax=Agaricus bisporus var. burnettii TaxID=192524 RepID=A0A8H7EW17_AGABI|nr:hypothetical protein Agabi119p4_10053 [Agaricus bisporus var. burnettii]